MSPPSILLISGDGAIQRAAFEAARANGHGLTIACTAHEALKQFIAGFEGFNLIVADLDPDVHGVTLFNAIDESHGTAPIVALTSYEEVYMKPLVLNRGAVECLGKPVAASRFVQLFDQYCSAASPPPTQ
jgi:DNA-binding NtrC family response regulator